MHLNKNTVSNQTAVRWRPAAPNTTAKTRFCKIILKNRTQLYTEVVKVKSKIKFFQMPT